MPRAVAWIDYHREVGAGLEPGDGRQGEREAGVRFKRADPALAEHHPHVAAVEDVFRGEEQFLDRRRRPALEEHGDVRLSDRLEEAVVLHVAGADLEDVGILGHERHVLRRHHLRDDCQPRLGPGLGEEFEPLFFEALEAVGARPRLEGAAAEPGGTGCLDSLRRGNDLLRTLHRAGAGDHADMAAADDQRPRPDNRRCRLDLAAGHLVGGEDRHHRGDPGKCFEPRSDDVALVADDGHDRPLRANDRVRLELQLLDARHHPVEVLARRASLHDDDHLGSLSFSVVGASCPGARVSPRFSTAARVVISIRSPASVFRIT